MDETRPRGRGPSGLVIELIVIVLGVLIALAVDAGWEVRQERERLVAYLAQIESDLRATTNLLQDAIREDSLVQEGAYRLEIGLNSRPIPSVDSMDLWLGMTMEPSLFHPRSGSVQALLGSGDLRLVSDRGLHQALLAYLDAASNFERLEPELSVAAIEAFGRLGHEVNYRTQVNLARGSEPPDWTRLAADPGVTSEIRQLQISANIRLSLLARLRDGHTALLAALEGYRGG